MQFLQDIDIATPKSTLTDENVKIKRRMIDFILYSLYTVHQNNHVVISV